VARPATAPVARPATAPVARPATAPVARPATAPVARPIGSEAQPRTRPITASALGTGKIHRTPLPSPVNSGEKALAQVMTNRIQRQRTPASAEAIDSIPGAGVVPAAPEVKPLVLPPVEADLPVDPRIIRCLVFILVAAVLLGGLIWLAP
jgi:hypothetical protein